MTNTMPHDNYLYNSKLALYEDEYATEYALTPINYYSDLKVIFYALVAMTLAYFVIRNYIFKLLGYKVLVNGNNMETLLNKWCTTGWRFISYTSMLLVGLWALKPEMHWFFNIETYCSIFKDNIVPPRIRLYYLLEMVFYSFLLVNIFYEPRLKDHNQMVLHHSVTLILLSTSYYLNTMRYGVAILILHELSDPLLELAKLLNYAKINSLANIAFGLFMSVFIVTRCYIFPVYIVTQLYRHSKLVMEVVPFMRGSLVFLISLCLMHYIWAVMILKVFWNVLWGTGKRGDIRE